MAGQRRKHNRAVRKLIERHPIVLVVSKYTGNEIVLNINPPETDEDAIKLLRAVPSVISVTTNQWTLDIRVVSKWEGIESLVELLDAWAVIRAATYVEVNNDDGYDDEDMEWGY